MKVPRYSKPRPKRLDLYRRAALLGVTPQHLSQVLSGKRQSARLLRDLDRLIERDAVEQTKTTLKKG
jgi:predicted transcriptional regulator